MYESVYFLKIVSTIKWLEDEKNLNDIYIILNHYFLINLIIIKNNDIILCYNRCCEKTRSKESIL